MSIYSVDSLEDVGRNLKVDDTSNESCQSKASTKSHNHQPFYLNPDPSLPSSGNDDGGSNESVRNCSHDRKTKAPGGGRNAIIARGGLANASQRLESSTTNRKDEGKEGTEDEMKEEVEGKHETSRRRDALKKEANERTRKGKDDRRSLPRKPMGFFSKGTTPVQTKCGFHVQGVDEEAETEVTMKPDKKLSNVFVLTSNAGIFKKPETSYLEIHRRRSSLPRYKYLVRSPEGSTLSIYGDSQRDELNTEEEESGRISCSSRDDQSELSFYRRLIEQSATRLPRTSRSCETVRNRSGSTPPPPPPPPPPSRITANLTKSSDNFPGIRTPFKSSASESKLSKKTTYKPYTIEDYRSLPVPKPDRSLGPDKDEILAKREWLMRRRSYGDSVSERNRQQIVHTAQRFKSRRIAPRKCFLPPLKHRDTDTKTHVNSSTEKTENEGTEGRNHPPKFDKSKKNIETTSFSLSRKLNSSRRIKKQGKLTNRSVALNPKEVVEDSYLDTLRQRHLREKELVDKLIKQGTST